MNDKNINKSLTSKFNSKHILIIGIALRLIYFVINLIVGGNHIDEAMLGLNSYYLANDLTDAAGERLPIYFDTWLYGGQSPLPTYLSAASVKVFGMNLFAIRLPMLIVSIIGLVFFYLFIEEVFKTDREKIIMNGIACISPWLIFSSAYVLDCNYLAHMMIIAFYFMARAINTKKLKYYAFSMVFFALGFYCYIASVLIIPAILVIMFLTLLIKKKIGFKEVAISIVTIVLVSLPFILFGLVNIDLLPDLNFLGFSISKMPYYTRSDSVAFSEGNAIGYLANTCLNLVKALCMIIIVESNIISIGMNLFQYSNLFGGLFIIAAFIRIAKSLRKKENSFSFVQKLFLLSFTTGIIFYCLNINNADYVFAYRYGILTYMLLLIEGIGISGFFETVSKKTFSKILGIYLIVSFVIFNFMYFGLYSNQIKNSSEIKYGDSLYLCLDKAEDIGADKIELIEDISGAQERTSVFCRNYYLLNNEPIDFINLGAEFEERNKDAEINISITNDDSIEFISSDNCTFSGGDFYIIRTEGLSELQNIPDDFTSENMGSWSIIYKQ